MGSLDKRLIGLAAITVVGVAAAVGATVAFAFNGDGTTTAIQACAQKATGRLRIVDDAADCIASEDSVVWPGLLGFYTGFAVEDYDGGIIQSVDAFCDPGDVALGGGYQMGPILPISRFNKVVFPGPTEGWRLSISNGGGVSDGGMNVSVQCLDLTP